LQIDKHTCGYFVFWIVKGAQAIVENAFWHLLIFRDWEPLLVWIMHKRAISDGFAQPEISKEIVSRQAFEILTQRRG